jgi:hypothetical protein
MLGNTTDVFERAKLFYYTILKVQTVNPATNFLKNI